MKRPYTEENIEMREKIVNMPLKYPYANYKAMKLRTPMEVRFDTASYYPTDEMYKEYGLGKDYLPELIVAKYQAGKHLAMSLEKSNLTLLQVSRLVKLDKSTISRWTTRDRPFSSTPKNLVNLSEYVIGDSCHYIMFGEEGEVLLPSLYSNAACILMSYGRSYRSEMRSKIASIAMRAAKENKDDPAKDRDSDYFYTRILSERMRMLSDDMLKTPGTFFSDEADNIWPKLIRTSVKSMMEGDPEFIASLHVLMFIALETGYSLDFFINPNFCLKSNLYFKRPGRKTKYKLLDRNVLRIMNYLFNADPETRSEMFSLIFGDGLRILDEERQAGGDHEFSTLEVSDEDVKFAESDDSIVEVKHVTANVMPSGGSEDEPDDEEEPAPKKRTRKPRATKAKKEP